MWEWNVEYLRVYFDGYFEHLRRSASNLTSFKKMQAFRNTIMQLLLPEYELNHLFILR